MKFSLLTSCALLALSLAGCADHTQSAPKQVAQKQASTAPRVASGLPPQNNMISTSPLTSAPIPPKTGKAKVAILLPLSGANAAIGQAMLNAAQQAVFDSAGANFELQPHDTALEGGAAEAARLALSDGSQLIIGPLFAGDVPPVKALAGSRGVEVLPLSTDTSLAEPGVYVLGLAPAAQVDRVVDYAVAHGAHRFAALIPSTPYGGVVGTAFTQAVSHHGGVMVTYEVIDTTSNDSALRVKAVAAQKGVDVLFLPEGGTDLKIIGDQLTAAAFDASHTHILGTGLWDGQNVGHLSPILLGAWYAAPDPATRRNFIAAYNAAYGQEPPRLATLAYDATALAAVLAKNGRFDEAALTNPNGFAGLDGIFRLAPSGLVERGLAVMEITGDGARVADPSPATFVGKK